YQDKESFTEGIPVPADRKKPWGTAHAVLCAMSAINEPFAVINADDFYGRDAFEKAFDFLMNDCTETNYAIIGYDLVKTLSDYGTVNRGVCTLDNVGNLVAITERINIGWKDKQIICDDGLEPKELPTDTRVSMNFWCFHPTFFSYTQKLFREFLQEHGQEPKSEFFIPLVADQFIREGGRVEVIPTTSSWFGVTYKEDAPFVKNSLDTLISAGEYPERLWNQ
ncbi:MAG: nucleotidyltransferase, partial [Chitinophagaceae bacterium]